MNKIFKSLSPLYYNEKRKSLLLFNLFIIIYTVPAVCFKVVSIWNSFMNPSKIVNYAFSDWLINYQGGFVRRGLLGEIIFQISTTVNVFPGLLMAIFSIIFFITTIVIFFVVFKSRKYCWWMLPMVIYLCDVTPARKDFLIFSLTVLFYYVFTTISNNTKRFLLLNCLAIFSCCIHEIFFMINIPVVLLIVLFNKDYGSILFRLFYFAPTCITFLLLGYYKGEWDTAWAIHNSWSSIMPNTYPNEPFATVAAIGQGPERYLWEFHHYNLESSDHGINVLWVRPLWTLLIFIFSTNILRVLNPHCSPISDQQQKSQLILTTFEFLPILMFYCVGFSDYTRLMEYWLVPSIVAFAFLPPDIVVKTCPKPITNALWNFNSIVTKVVNGRYIFMFLVLTLGGSAVGLNFTEVYHSTILGRTLDCADQLLSVIIPI